MIAPLTENNALPTSHRSRLLDSDWSGGVKANNRFYINALVLTLSYLQQQLIHRDPYSRSSHNLS